MTGIRSKTIIIISSLLLIFTLLLTLPAPLFAQEEEETLEFDVEYGDITDSGSPNTVFEFTAAALYEGPERKYFDVEKDLPPGWEMEVNTGMDKVDTRTVRLVPGDSLDLTFKCSPLIDQDPGEYIFKVTLKPVDGSDPEASAEFTADVKPAGELVVTTPDERLNTKINVGKENVFKLLVKNIGSAPVEDITVSNTVQLEGWQVYIAEDHIDILNEGEEAEVEVIVIPPDRTISGDYNIDFKASSEESTDIVSIRNMVQTPLLWKITGIAIIAAVIAGIAVLFERMARN